MSLVNCFPCLVCSQQVPKTLLRTHISIHFSYNPYVCKICRSAFPDIDYLQNHAIERAHLPLQITRDEDPRQRDLVDALQEYTLSPNAQSARALVDASNGIVSNAHERFSESVQVAALVGNLFGVDGPPGETRTPVPPRPSQRLSPKTSCFIPLASAFPALLHSMDDRVSPFSLDSAQPSCSYSQTDTTSGIGHLNPRYPVRQQDSRASLGSAATAVNASQDQRSVPVDHLRSSPVLEVTVAHEAQSRSLESTQVFAKTAEEAIARRSLPIADGANSGDSDSRERFSAVNSVVPSSHDRSFDEGLVVSGVRSLFDDVKAPRLYRDSSVATALASESVSSAATEEFRSLFETMIKTSPVRCFPSGQSSLSATQFPSQISPRTKTAGELAKRHSSTSDYGGSVSSHTSGDSQRPPSDLASPRSAKGPTPDSGVHEVSSTTPSPLTFVPADGDWFLDKGNSRADCSKHEYGKQSPSSCPSTSFSQERPATTSQESCESLVKPGLASNPPALLACNACGTEVENSVITLLEHTFACRVSRRRTANYLYSCKVCSYKCSYHMQIAKHIAKHVLLDGEDADEVHYDLWINNHMNWATFKQDFRRCFDESLLTLVGVIDLKGVIREFVEESTERKSRTQLLRKSQRSSFQSRSSSQSSLSERYTLRSKGSSRSSATSSTSGSEDEATGVEGNKIDPQPFRIILNKLSSEQVNRAIEAWRGNSQSNSESDEGSSGSSPIVSDVVGDPRVSGEQSDSDSEVEQKFRTEETSDADLPSTSGNQQHRAPLGLPPFSGPDSPSLRKRKASPPGSSKSGKSSNSAPESSRKVACNLCSVKIASDDERRQVQHILMHVQKDTPIRLYACRICMFQTNTANSMVGHVLDHCKHDDESPEIQHYTVRWTELSNTFVKLWVRAFPTLDILDIRDVSPTFVVDVHSEVQERYIQLMGRKFSDS